MASVYLAPALVKNECVSIGSCVLGRRKAGMIQITGINAQYQCSTPQGRTMTKKLRGLKGIYDTANRIFWFEGQSVEKIIRKFGEDAVKDLVKIILPKIQVKLFQCKR